jgi:hypothetical protein
MKHVIVVTLFILGSAAAMGQVQPASSKTAVESLYARAGSYRSADIERLAPRYLYCLSSKNDGVVSCTIGVLARMALYNDRFDSRNIQEEMSKLADASGVPSIRYRAYLASMLLENPEWFAEEGAKEYQSDDDLFFALSNRLSKIFLSRSGNLVAR